MRKITVLVVFILGLFNPVFAADGPNKCAPEQKKDWCEMKYHRKLARQILAQGIPLYKPGHPGIAIVCGKKNQTIHIVLKPDDKSGRTLTVKSKYPFKIFGIWLNSSDKGFDDKLHCYMYSVTFYDINNEPVYGSYTVNKKIIQNDDPDDIKEIVKVEWGQRVILTPSENQQEFWFETL